MVHWIELPTCQNMLDVLSAIVPTTDKITSKFKVSSTVFSYNR